VSEIRVQIGADVQGAVQGFTRVSDAASKFSAAAGRATQAMSRLTPVANQSTMAMTNLSRVVQDAPYGFIGIANNLNPLLESFQRLKATTGSTGGAFKELGKSLIGPGGIGLAIGVVSSLLVVFGDKLFGSSKAAKEADDANQKLAQGFAASAVKLTALVGVVLNLKTSYEDKQRALKAINEEYGGYLKNLGIEEVTVNNVRAAYDRLIDSMLKQAVVKGLMDEISKAVEDAAKKIILVEKAERERQQKEEKANKERERTVSSYEKMGKELNRFNATQRDGILAQQGVTEEQTAQIGTLNNYDAAIKRVKDDLMKTIAPALSLVDAFSDLGITLSKDKITKDDWVMPMPTIRLQPGEEPTIDIKKVKFILMGGVVRTFAEQMMDKINKDIEKLAKPLQLMLSPEALKNRENLEIMKKFGTDMAKALNDGMKSAIAGGIGGLGDIIGEAFSGGDIKSAFHAFVETLGSS
jgi:hypothetical protein